MKILVLACIALSILVAPTAWSVRAALDFTFRIADGGVVKETMCDFCGYLFRDKTGQLFTLSVNAAGGTVDVFFLRFGTPEASRWGPIVHPQEPARSASKEFEVGYLRKARVREGQTLRLRGSDIEFTLLDAFGHGCPAGVKC